MNKTYFKLALICIAIAFVFNLGQKHEVNKRRDKLALRVESQVASAKYEREQVLKKRRQYVQAVKELTFDSALAYAKNRLLGGE